MSDSRGDLVSWTACYCGRYTFVFSKVATHRVLALVGTATSGSRWTSPNRLARKYYDIQYLTSRLCSPWLARARHGMTSITLQAHSTGEKHSYNFNYSAVVRPAGVAGSGRIGLIPEN